jgi:RimJ/RimL family protein N-acetyltransferase
MALEHFLIQRPSLALRQGGIRLLAMKVFTTFYRRMFLMVRPLDATTPDVQPRLPVVIKRLTDKDLCAYRRFRPEQGAQMIRTRLAQGDQCYAAWHEGRIVHAGWIATERVYVPYLRRDLILQPGDVYHGDSFTLPTYRGYGLSPAKAICVMHHYRQQGYRRMVCLIAVENTTGLHVMRKLGYQPIGLYRCLRFGPWQRDWQQVWDEEVLLVLTRTEEGWS